MKLLTARGMKDYLPEEKIALDKIISELKEIFERFGYAPLETPAIERFDVLSSKYAGGSEILKETFRLKDQGGRELALRYDLTVPLCRVIGMNPNLKMPFKRYQIEKVWRDGPVESARYREFYQCDIDIVGVKSLAADAECLAIASEFFSKVGLEFEILVNNRKILDELLDKLKIPAEKKIEVMLSLDKLKKFGEKAVIEELMQKGIERKKIDLLLEAISVSGSNEEKISKLEKFLGTSTEGIKEMEELLRFCEKFNVKNVVFSPTLARGLAYYTGPIFEVVLKKSKVKSSVAAGGRYDKMIGSLLGSKQEFPATGFSFGLARIYDALIDAGKLEKLKTKTKIFVIPIATFYEALAITSKIRSLGINCDIDLMERSISKNLEYANKMGIPFVAIVGEDELKENCIKLRNMKTGKEELIKIREIEKLKELLKDI